MEDLYNVVGIIVIMVGIPLGLMMLMFRFLLWRDHSEGYKKIKPFLMRVLFGKRWREEFRER